MNAMRILLERCLAALPALIVAAPAGAQVASHYELVVRPDFERHQLQVKARVHIDGHPGNELSGTDLLIRAPTLKISSAHVLGQELALRWSVDGWLLRLPDGSRQTPVDIELTYQAAATDGLVFGPDYVYTAYASCSWLPCVGLLLDRATLQVAFELPADYLSVASGGPRAYPLYTLGFAAGHFSEWREQAAGRTLRYLGAVDDKAGLRARFSPTAAMIDFFEVKAGVPLPSPTYTQVLIPGDEAQEVSSHSVIGKTMLDPILQTPEEDWVIAHELAHQWWGNLVTCADWPDFWLNEGLATFMTAAWKQHRWGEQAYQRELDLATRRWERAKEAGMDRPLSWPGSYPSLSLRRAVQYSKGMLFMHTLRQEMGDERFWMGIRRYTQTNAGRSVRTADLQAAMESAAGRSLSIFFDQWAY